MIEAHGRSGSWARVSAVTWLAAASTISIAHQRKEQHLIQVEIATFAILGEADSRIPARVEQEFPVAFWAEDRALDEANYRPARLPRNPGGSALADLVMDGGIADHPAFADLLAAGLELRLDERHERGFFGGECQRRRQYLREPNEARIAGDQVNRFGNMGSGQVPGVQSFLDNDPQILPQFPG